MAGKPNRRGFGYVRKLPNGRYQASYIGPDSLRHNGPKTFEAKADAEAWLADENRLVALGTWTSPKQRATPRDVLTFSVYADAWLKDRDLKPRTRQHYRSLLDKQINPTFGHLGLGEITPDSVRAWHALLGPSKPTLRAHAYGLMRTILGNAEKDELITKNPCYIRAAGSSKRVHKVKPLSLAELEVLVAAMPAERQAMTLLAAWCAMRFGELAELRRKDVDLTNEVIKIRRGVVRADGKVIVGTPKTESSIRDVAIPPHLVPILRTHLKEHVGRSKEALLFPGTDGHHLAPSTLYGRKPTKKFPGYGFYAARAAAGRPDLRWHDLRHTGAVLAAQTGASLAELMGRLGHSTPGAALRYQHAAEERDKEIARRLSEMAEGGKQ